MKVLFYARPDYYTNPAGDTIQIIATGQGLKALGVEVVISSDPNILLKPYDLIHLFNITRIKESYFQFLNAQKQKKRIVLTPIYWNPRQFLQSQASGANSYAVWKHAQPMRARLLRECDLILPNAQSEMDAIRLDFPRTAPYTVIPNGFPDAFPEADPALFRRRFPGLPEDFVLCVARISPRKNQMWLAKACQELSLPLVLIGPINNRNYFEKVRAVHGVFYLGALQGELLASAYKTAKIHALPSWFETPGLSSLEAGACGTSVVSTDQGSPHEYFKDMVAYANPGKRESLRPALEQALTQNPRPLQDHIRANYSWSQAARLTLAAYQSVLSPVPEPALSKS